MRRLELAEIARADLKSIRRYSERTWGLERTAQYMATLRDTMKGLVAGTVVSRKRDDLRPGLRAAKSIVQAAVGHRQAAQLAVEVRALDAERLGRCANPPMDGWLAQVGAVIDARRHPADRSRPTIRPDSG